MRKYIVGVLGLAIMSLPFIFSPPVDRTEKIDCEEWLTRGAIFTRETISDFGGVRRWYESADYIVTLDIEPSTNMGNRRTAMSCWKKTTQTD